MRHEPPEASIAAPLLAKLPIADVVTVALRRPDSDWLVLALASGRPPEDRGLHWVVLEDDLTIWPVRVFIAQHLGERHAVWLTYGPPEGRDLEVQTQADDSVLASQAGESGRVRLLSRQDETDSASAASD